MGQAGKLIAFSLLASCLSILWLAQSGCDRTPPEHQAPMHEKGGVTMKIAVTSEAFAVGQPIPRKHTGEGENLSPPLHFHDVPAEARQIVLICDDPDAPRPEPWIHWVIYSIPGHVDNLVESIEPTPNPPSPSGAVQGVNSSGKVGYSGPMPPPGHGVHHYHFKVYALDAELNLQPGLTKADVLAAIDGHVIAEGELVGTYERK